MAIITIGGKRLIIGHQVATFEEPKIPPFDWKSNLIGYFKFNGNLKNEFGDLTFTGNSPFFGQGINNRSFKLNSIIEGNKHQYSEKISFGFWYKSNNSGYILSFVDSIYLSDRSISLYNSNFYNNYTDYGIYDGAWHHFLLTLDGLIITIYRDGTVLYIDNIGTLLDNYNLNLKIPQIAITDFLIDELAVWDGRIITQTDVTQLYNGGNGLFI